jgi:hypothetical protein
MSYKVNHLHTEYQDWATKAGKCRTFMAGEDAIKKEAETYLPRLSGQTIQEYRQMKDRTMFYAAAKRTKMALSGAIHRKDAVVSIDAGYEDYLKDITLTNTPFNVFAKDATDEILVTGRFVICTDWDEGMQRPYLRGYNGESLINFRYANHYGKQILTLAVLQETKETESDSDPFTTEYVTCYRVKVLINGIYHDQLYAPTDKKGSKFELVQDIVPSRNGAPLNFIPITVVNTNNISCYFEESMLNDLVDLNRSHYLSAADIGIVLHFSALPTLTITGVTTMEDSEPIRLGSTNSIILPPGATASILEFSGASSTAIRQHLQDLENRMATLGARLLQTAQISPATSTAEIIKAASETTALRALAQNLDTGLEQAISQMIWWSGVDTPTVDVNLNKDFLSSKLSPSELTSLSDAYLKGALNAESYFSALSTGEMIPANIDKDAEIKRLENMNLNTDGMNVRSQRNQGPDTAIQAKANNSIQ